jgi:hypothetical protein
VVMRRGRGKPRFLKRIAKVSASIRAGHGVATIGMTVTTVECLAPSPAVESSGKWTKHRGWEMPILDT